MRRSLKLGGVSIGGNGLPASPRDAMDDAFGLVPGLAALFAPEYHETARGVKNLAAPAAWAMPSAALAFGQINSQPAFNFAEASARLQVGYPLDRNRWSFWTVVGALGSPTNPTQPIFKGNTSIVTGAPEIGLRLGLSQAGSVRAWKNQGQTSTADSTGAELRLSYTPDVPLAGRAALLMWTFSIEEGLKIMDNGQVRAAAPNDRRPLDANIGPIDVFHFCRATFGVSGWANADLSRAQNAGYRRGIESYLMQKYGITG